MKKLMIIVFIGVMVCGCTQTSVKLAQQGSARFQEIQDGIVHDMSVALSRENFEVAKLTILNSKSEQETVAALTEFAQKRDATQDWLVDHERGNAIKYVSVDAKLFSEQSIFDYLFGKTADFGETLLNAWPKKVTTTQPGG